MSFFDRVRILRKSIRQLGFSPVAMIGLYKLGILSGYYRVRTPPDRQLLPFRIPSITPDIIRNFGKHGWNIPTRQYLLENFKASLPQLRNEADEIVNRQVRLFGDDPVPLQLSPARPLKHWSLISDDGAGENDIKFTWEPARFGWAYTLGRAYIYTGDEKYSETFWKYTDEFLENNPTNLGPNWVSAQELGLRILAFAFSLQVFQYSPHSTLSRQAHLIKSIREHANRIPLTLIYAQAQNNNHLLSEAAGLYTAAIFLPHLSQAKRWKKAAWQWFLKAILAQIQPDGTYIQQSVNYHRLMLQIALWMKSLGEKHGDALSADANQRLIAATNWLLVQIDPISGKCPNLGHNDGANLFPLFTAEFSDFRPVIQAASIAFRGEHYPIQNPLNEFCIWLGLSLKKPEKIISASPLSNPVGKIQSSNTWATLRAARFINRPAHADQLHVDLWWQGCNIALDPGTYRYTSPSPWNNSLMSTRVHNTMFLEETDQMKRAGRFLWVDWAQAHYCPEDEHETILVAEHDGYKNLGCIHRRSLAYNDPNEWIIKDSLIPTKSSCKLYKGTLNWLIPDSEWEIENSKILIKLPVGTIQLDVTLGDEKIIHSKQESGAVTPDSPVLKSSLITSIRIVKGGVPLVGENKNGDEILGWYSPTYGKKIPALSFQISFEAQLPFSIKSQWILSSE